MGLKRFGGQFRVVDSGRNGHDLAPDNHPGIDASEHHADQVPESHIRAGHDGLNPKPEVPRQDSQEDQDEDCCDDKESAKNGHDEWGHDVGLFSLRFLQIRSLF
jgi:hypothetical protein